MAPLKVNPVPKKPHPLKKLGAPAGAGQDRIGYFLS